MRLNTHTVFIEHLILKKKKTRKKWRQTKTISKDQDSFEFSLNIFRGEQFHSFFFRTAICQVRTDGGGKRINL